MRKQRGVYLVEFTITASILMMLLFGCIEFGRGVYTFAALNEGTRRAARLAVVCPINDPAITAAVNFLGVPNFTNANVSVSYLDVNGASLGAAPALANVAYVRVAVVGYTVPLGIPFINPTLISPPFTVTLPAESLGLSNTGVSTAC
ncbi:MAG: TadE/TadG family type IV pilus assembly protein [Steroidobacteraceae bacterium]